MSPTSIASIPDHTVVSRDEWIAERRRLLAREKELTRLGDEIARARRALCETLAGRCSVLSVDGEVVTIEASSARIVVRPGEPAPGVAVAARCRTSRQTIWAVLEAQLELMDAIRSDQLSLVGALLDLVAFHDALLQYVNGAVRCVSFPALRDEFFADCLARERQRSATERAVAPPERAARASAHLSQLETET